MIDMLVGGTQRITEYAGRGFAIEQDIPHDWHAGNAPISGFHRESEHLIDICVT